CRVQHLASGTLGRPRHLETKKSQLSEHQVKRKGLTESHSRDHFRDILHLLKVPDSVKYSSGTILIQNLPCQPVELHLDLFVTHWILGMPLVIVNLFRHNSSSRKLHSDPVRHRFRID